MSDSKKTRLAGAMAFYHDKGFVSAYKQASKYAGKNGHIGTLLDWVDFRLGIGPYKEFGYHDPENPTPWDQYYTTMSAEYVGYGKEGLKILIVAHGIGPMSTLDGVLAAYSWHYNDKSRNREGGRISAEEFLKLESGYYGDVEIVDLEDYIRTREYPFIAHLHSSEAMNDPVLRARLGPKAVDYIKCHRAYAIKFHEQVHHKRNTLRIDNPYIIDVRGPASYWVDRYKIEDGMACAHLLSVGGISTSHHRSEYNVPSWMSDIHVHEWYDGVRLIGVREGDITSIGKGPDPYHLLRTHWQELLVPSGNKRPLPGNFYTLMKLPDGTWFVQCHKPGAAMDNGEPEYLVTSIEPIGEPVSLYTDIHHYHGFFKYAKSEVRRVVEPLGANAFALVGDPSNIWKDGNPVQQTCLVQAYRINIDHTRRLVSQDELGSDYERMMELMKVA